MACSPSRTALRSRPAARRSWPAGAWWPPATPWPWPWAWRCSGRAATRWTRPSPRPPRWRWWNPLPTGWVPTPSPWSGMESASMASTPRGGAPGPSPPRWSARPTGRPCPPMAGSPSPCRAPSPAWVALSRRFGRLAFRRLLEPAIHYAAEGHRVPPLTAQAWQEAEKRFAHREDFRAAFLPGGRAPRPASSSACPTRPALCGSSPKAKGRPSTGGSWRRRWPPTPPGRGACSPWRTWPSTSPSGWSL